ncbi:MAG: hypothetical protein QOD12_567 [Verrucomicrobiota bacterium]|jgi:hypothetical protein
MPPTKKSKAKTKKKPAAKETGAAANRRFRGRTYRHGLGDCHLLRFTKPDGSFLHMLIDCGVVDVTPKPVELMTGVAQDIAKETKGNLDIVVATHQHTDHLSGFQQAAPEFDKMKMKRLWFAWTEDKANPLGKKIKGELVKKLAAARAAVSALKANGGPQATAAAARIKGVLDFFGPGVAGAETQAILDSLQTRALSPPEYFEPGMVFNLPEVPNVRVYVLGPPKDPADLKITNPRASKKEGYQIALAAAADGLASALGGGDQEPNQPFDPRYRRTPAEAQKIPFFKNNYFAPDKDRPKNPDWRHIDTAWLEMAEQLALYLNDFTNNTSLALAFEFIDTGEVFLFPGDAQIGSWLTWQRLSWTVKDRDGSKREVKIGDLFAKTIFYKAAHHASHNGTLSGRGENQTGLEQMTHRDLTSVVPVDRKMSVKKHWDRTLPWQPLLTRLAEKTRGRLILTDTNETPPDPTKLPDLTPAEQKRFAEQITVAPGWVDYVL